MDDPVCACAPHVRLVHDFSPGPAMELPVRRIADHALLFVQHGHGTLTASGREHALGPGSLMIIPPEREHAFRLSSRTGVRMLNIHYDPVIGHDSVQVQRWDFDAQRPRPAQAHGPLFPGGDVQVVMMLPATGYVAAFRRVGRSWPQAHGARLLRQRAAMLELLALVLDAATVGARPRAGTQLERARRHLEDGRGVVRLEDAARLACLGRSAFAVAFVRHFGLSPLAYRRQARIERAKADLQWDGMTVKAVARQAGFANVHHFTRVFARLVGEPPAAYAARMRGQ